MQKAAITFSLVAAVVVAALAPASSFAREGSQVSVGKGVKCRNAAVTQPDGTVKIQRVCSKGV
jgi:hypothetical protein